MATGIASAMLTELQGLGRVFPVFELTVGGTTYRFAEGPIASESQGRYEPFVESWGIIDRGVDLRGYSLLSSDTEVIIYDKDRVFQKLIGGPGGGAIIGATAKIVLRSYNVVAASHYTIFDGVASDYKLLGDHIWQFTLTPDDLSLRASGNKIPTLASADWFSELPAASVGADGQIVYGEHISSGVEGATGMVNCTIVYDSGSASWWYVSIGVVEEVIAVWRNGTLATSDFDLNEAWTINGAIYSLIKDTTGTSTEDDTITIDVKGVEDNGLGTGTLITDPIDMIQHFLVNFVFGSYPTGSSSGEWLSVSGKPINTTHLGETKTFLSDRNHRCAKVITSSDNPLTVLNDFCSDYKINPFWSWDWDLGIRALDPAASIYSDTQIVQVKHKILSELRGQTDSSKIISRIVGDYLYREAANAFAYQRRVEDPDRTLISTADSFAYGESKI